MNDRGRRRERDEAQDDDLQPPLRRRRIELAINPIPRRLGVVAETVVSFWHFLFLQGRLHDGTYYTTISDLWGTEAARPFNNEVAKNALRRLEIKTALKKCRHVQNGQKTFIDPYNATARRLRDHSFFPKPVPSRTSHGNSSTKEVIWPQNILDTSNNGEIARLLPAGPQDAVTWWFITTWLFGWGDRRAMNSWNARMKAIHGYSKHNRSRTEHTGIKHMVTNKVRIAGQRQYMDNNPCLLIVPILTTQEVKDWDGSGYDAIVVIDRWDGCRLDSVAAGTEMSSTKGIRKTATGDEIKTARELLSFFLRAILTARQSRPHGAPTPSDDMYSGDSITIPSRNLLHLPLVRKVSFVAQTWDNPEKHPAPDPMLLATKAAVVFSTRHNQRLAAGGFKEDETWTDMDQQAAEEYLDWRQAAIRARMDEDVARGILGQS
jgi:hypothetical protein